MTIDVFTSTGTKKGTAELPEGLFETSLNKGLMHQFLILQQSNRRAGIAHAKNRSEVQGSTKKLFQQKGTGRARRGSIRSPLLRGGGKAFGPRSNANFVKEMPRSMRHSALKACLSFQARNGKIIGLESYPEAIKTKDALALLKKLPVSIGRRILFVVPGKHDGLALSVRNIPRVKTVMASYLNPEDVLVSNHIIFLVDALKKADEVFGKKKGTKAQKREQVSESTTPMKKKPKPEKAPKVSKKKKSTPTA